MDVLCHHGIKGQKWGVRRGPPYPINEARISSIRKITSSIKAEVEKYASGGPSGNQNCQLCTWALESQFRGKSVLPRPVYSPRDIAFEMNGYDIVKNPVKLRVSNKNDVVKYISNAGDGGRFYVHVNWKGRSSGHEFIVVNFDGDAYIADGQAGLIRKMDSKSTKSYFDDINYKNSYLVRMDDKELNPEILKYNNHKYVTYWDWEKDISYMLKNGMIEKSEAEEALRLRHSIISDVMIVSLGSKKERLGLWDKKMAARCYNTYIIVHRLISNSSLKLKPKSQAIKLVEKYLMKER